MEFPLMLPDATNQIKRPFNLGKVFYVDSYGPEVSDSHEGTDPNRPLLTIATALGKCTAGQNDYIIVLDAWSEDTEPIVVNKARTHIIGINTGPMAQWVVVTPSSDTAVFQIPTAGQHCEIAGFNIGGGESRGGIQTQTSPFGVWIHHNVFGHEYPGGNTPLYGIESDTSPTGMVHSLIEDNFFYGDEAGFGKIDGIAVIMYGCKGLVLRRNFFIGLTAINVQITDAVQAIIVDNQFALDGNTTGRAITLVGCDGCWINGNSAGNAKSVMSNIPWADNSANNHWGINPVQKIPDTGIVPA